MIARHSNQYSAALPKEHSACLTLLSQWLAADCNEGVVSSDSPTCTSCSSGLSLEVPLSCTDSVLPHLSVELEHQRA